MRYIYKACLVLVLLTLAGGPLAAAALSLSSSPTVSAASSTPSSPARRAVAGILTGLAVFGAIAVKDPSKSAKKFVARAGAAAGDYKDGVSNAGGAWEAATKASDDAYKQGVQAAIADGRFAKGVNGAGGKFQKNATELGSARYTGGIANAEGAYQAGVAPYLSKIASLTLPAKGMRGSPQNQQRSSIIATELNKLRLGK